MPVYREETDIEFGSVEPDILAVRTFLAPFLDNLSSLHHLFRVHFKRGGCDPAWSMFRVGGDEILQELAGLLDVPDSRQPRARELNEWPYPICASVCKI